MQSGIPARIPTSQSSHRREDRQMILILTERSDSHADHVIELLRRRDAEFVRFNPAQFPAEAQVSLAFGAGGPEGSSLELDGERVDLDRVTAVWYRRPELPAPHDEITDPRVREYLAEECRLFVNDLWHTLDCRWLPAPPAVLRRADLKATQLKLASTLGFEIPPSLFTNSPESLLEFYREHNGNIISKLTSPSFFNSLGDYYTRYTEVVSRRDVGYAQQVRYGPVIFQAYVPKRVELRVTVVGDEVFAAEIHSQASNHTRYDWRRYDHYETVYLPHELPRAVEDRCLELVRRLGLCYGAIDLILTPDDRYVFLEINPNGQYLWIEEATGLPISDAICDLLMSGAPVSTVYPRSEVTR